MFAGYKYFRGIYHAFFLSLIIIISGTLGYMIIEEWSFLNSFYMTIITITTVGFMEVEPLSDAGRIFTAVLILTSFGTIAYAVSVITSYLASGELKKYRREILSVKSIQRMENHTIVCGFGRVGKQAAQELLFYNKKVVVIEKRDILMSEIPDGITLLHGDSTKDEILIKAGIHKADSLITALPEDTDNLFVVLSAHELNPKLKIIARSSDLSSVKKLKVAGANNVIMPDTVGGSHMASLVVTPDLMEFIDLIRVSGNSAINLEEISFEQLNQQFKGCTINELQAKSNSGCNVIGYKSPDGYYSINPDPETKILSGAKLFVLGNPQQIEKINKTLGI
ncbi:MAG: potassium channel protein [Crocinitomicaceae bacterium]|nr:potassium channel protein [Crocinitomicaceae bacterium]